MPQSTNLNKAPYFDDFDPLKNFYRVLFRPGYSIQSRELTTLQSILQNQIETLAKSKYRQGSIVVPGEIIYDDKYEYVKVSSFTNNLSITDYIGKKMTGSSSGVVATIVNATAKTETDDATLYVKYENSGNSKTSVRFSEGETIIANSQGNPTAIVGITGSVNPTNSSALGYGSAVEVKAGVYFINGSLVRNENQTVILDKYSNLPSYKVGFIVSEQLVTPEEDLSLLDNAQGYSNYTAPGAHRFKVALDLVKRPTDFPDQRDFVELLLIEDGIIKRTVENVNTTLFEDILARRTYDESGDYIVRDFSVSLKEHLNDGTNNGRYTAAQGGNSSKFIAELSPGKAYIRGYEIETTSTRYIEVDKARDYNTQQEVFLSILEGSNFTVRNLYRFPDIETTDQNLTGTGISAVNSYQEINLYNSYSDTAFGESSASLDNTSPDSESYWVFNIASISSTTLVSAGTTYSAGSATGQIRVYKINDSGNAAVAFATKNDSNIPYGTTITMGGVTGTVTSIERISVPVIGSAKTKYIKFLAGTSNSTTKVYDKLNSQFKLGIFGAEYFTKIICKDAINFTVGKTITGQSSGATGIVEMIIADTREVILSKVVGTFVEGETLSSEPVGTSSPYNFVETEGSISYFKPVTVGSGYTTTSGMTISIDGVDKTSQIELSNVTLSLGRVTSVAVTNSTRLNLGNYSTSPTVTINGNGQGASYTAILNKNVIVNYDSSFVRSFFGSTEPNNSFAGDVSSIDSTYKISGGDSFSGIEGSYYITADNLNSRPDLDLISGDIIEVIDNEGITRRYIVKFATPSGSASTARVYVYGSVLSNFTTKTISRVRSVLNGISQNTSLMLLPNKHVKTAVLNPSNTDINYTIQREFIGKLGSAGTVSITVGTNQQFLSYSSDNYIFTNINTGDIVDLSSALTSNGSSITINLGVSYANVPFKLIAPVVKIDTAPKTKTLKTYEHAVSTGFSDDIIALKHADGYKLKAVYISTSGAPATVSSPEITDRFIFDGGQRETHYDLARLIRKPGAQIPDNNLLVVYEYFEHVGSSGTGDYFTVDSYTNIDYEDIPTFTSSVYGTISLADVIDFRPRVSDYTGNSTESVVPGYSDKQTLNALKFDGTGSSFSATPIVGTSFRTGYQYYLNRIDALYATKNGNFVVSRGTPSLNPQIPDEVSDSLLLYYLNIPAYTSNISDITIKSIDNRRYTMRDIGKLEKRIEKLEYYTVLSLLEQDTFNAQVKDEFGNERFKNGILVDNFEGHSVGNTLSTDYRCSIDTQTGVARPSYYASQTSLEELNITNSQRSADGYVKNGEIITLPFTEQQTISNPYATKTIDINPGKSNRFCGSLTLSPNIDEWKDTTTSPELIVNENSVFDSIKNGTSNIWGSIWNEWQIAWTGTPLYNLANSTNSDASSVNQFDTSTSGVIKGITRTRTRNGTQNRISPYGASTTSLKQRTVSKIYNPYIRSRIIKFVAQGLEPNTRLYAFFDGIDINSWVNPDDVTNIITPFTGIGGYAEKGFGEAIITDSNGNISGQILIPNGYAPIKGKKTVDYQFISSFFDTSSIERRFTAGTKTFRLTSSQTNSSDNVEVRTFTETEYFVSGSLDENSNTITSTRASSISRRSVSNTDTIQYIGNSKVNVNQSGLLDPIAQTFVVTGFEEGVFANSVDLYFSNKKNSSGSDTDRPVTVYLTETNSGIPSRKVVPFSEVTLNPDTILRIRLSTDVPNGIKFEVNNVITGKTSGAVGIVKQELNVTTSSTRYNLILTNHNGIEFLPEEEIVINRSPAITETKFYIDRDSGIVEGIKVTNFGSGYSTVSGNTTITINGDNGGSFGTAATAVAEIYDGKIYNIVLTNKGSGYYTPPSVTISSSTGTEATAETIFRITNPSVKMGIATSVDASVKTKFKFPSPVHLQNDSTYALVITSSSPDYKLYASRIGDSLINSTVLATAKPNIGSIFKSQNSSAWIEDEIEDIKFNINRCVFNTNATATIDLVNSNLDYVILPQNPITVDSTIGTSSLFGANPQLLKIHHPNHGLKQGDTVILSNVTGLGSPQTIYGIPVNIINGMHFVSNIGIDDYCIFIPTEVWNNASVTLTGSGTGGGTQVKATTNKTFQILQSQVSTLSFSSSSVSHSVRTAKGKSVDSTTTDEYTLDTETNITPGDNYYFDGTKVIASTNNEVLRKGGTLLNNQKSFKYIITMETSRDNVSPVLDLSRCNVITVGSKLDNPTGNEDRFGSKSQVLTVSTGSSYALSSSTQYIRSTILKYANASGGSFAVTGGSNGRLIQSSTGISGQIVSVTSDTIKLIDVTPVGAVFSTVAPVTQNVSSSTITTTPTQVTNKSGIITGWDSGTGLLKIKLTSESPFEINDFINDNAAGTSPITARNVTNTSGIFGFLYVDEISPIGGSVYSKYLTKEVTLETPAEALDCKITANLYNNSDIKVMYKIKPDGSTEDFSNIGWQYFNNTGLSDNNSAIIPNSLKSFSPSVEDLSSYIEYKYTANNLTPFKSFAIKILFTGSNPALAPRLEDIRVIAHS